MLKISKLSDYATVLLSSLAALGNPQSSTALAAHARLPAATVVKLLKALLKAGLVASTRGAHGGYRLTRAPELISVADILEALEGPLGLTACSTHGGSCVRAGFCGTRPHWHTINNAVQIALRSVTLKDLAHAPALPYVAVAKVAVLNT